MSLTIKQKSLYILSAIIVVGLALIGRDRITASMSDSKQKKSPQVLMRDFSEVPIPKDDRWSGSPDTFDKGVIEGVTTHILSARQPSEVVSYYSKELPSLGWRLSDDPMPPDRTKVKFCRDGVSLIVDASSSGSGTNYYLGVVWTSFQHGSSYCPT